MSLFLSNGTVEFNLVEAQWAFKLADLSAAIFVLLEPIPHMKKPTIKEFNRAYVRLYGIVKKQGDWEEFKAHYRVEIIEFGTRKHGDCGVRVLDTDGAPATLGSVIPNKITYRCFVEPSRTTWVEYFREGDTTRCETISG
ncbi:hypothetical protein [Polaromonas sp. LjRoot131]|uniref:hypothetical protein n=1 Tax=Polaromonas sp. LjRoot131 TaxID=3342262 RepID=UPI003ED0417E